MQWQLVEFNGHPAVTMGWENNQDKPQSERSVWYCPHEKWDEEYYSRFSDGVLKEHNYFLFFNRNTYTYSGLDTSGWIFAQEIKPIKSPGRGGKDWHWEWRYGKWNKTYGRTEIE